MVHIELGDAQAWAEATKLPITTLDDELVEQVESQVLGKLSVAVDIDDWTTPASTPSLVRNIIAMTYVSWLYSRTYSEDVAGSNEYALRLLAAAEANINAILSGDAVLVDGDPDAVVPGGPAVFYPTDASSALEANSDDMSLGGPKFTMGVIW
jgi:hypothetical protein